VCALHFPSSLVRGVRDQFLPRTEIGGFENCATALALLRKCLADSQIRTYDLLITNHWLQYHAAQSF
jgi:hypothetical protein